MHLSNKQAVELLSARACELQRIYRMQTLDTISSFTLGVTVVLSPCHMHTLRMDDTPGRFR